MSFYKHHVFFCCNQRTKDDPRGCCHDRGGTALRDYAKQKVKDMKLNGPGKVRINQSGCLDRCLRGPCAVVYPEAVWYRFADEKDVDEVIEQHLVQGKVVERLKLPD